jgi:hypothetical protein
MKRNIGTTDRLYRLSLAVITGIVAVLIDTTLLRLVLAGVSLFTFYEALVGWCALNALLGKNTCPISLKDEHSSRETN